MSKETLTPCYIHINKSGYAADKVLHSSEEYEQNASQIYQKFVKFEEAQSNIQQLNDRIAYLENQLYLLEAQVQSVQVNKVKELA